MDSKKQKEVEANLISQEPNNGDIQIYLGTSTNTKEVIPILGTNIFVTDLRAVLRVAGILEMMMGAVGIFLYLYGNPSYIYIPNWLHTRMPLNEVPLLLYAQFSFGFYLTGFSTQRPGALFLLAVLIYAASILTVLSTIEFLLVQLQLPIKTIEDLQPYLIHFISFGFHMLVIGLAKAYYNQSKENAYKEPHDEDEYYC